MAIVRVRKDGSSLIVTLPANEAIPFKAGDYVDVRRESATRAAIVKVETPKRGKQ